VLGFVVVEGDFEHVVATDADAMNLGCGFVGGLCGRAVRGGLRRLSFRHGRILARRGRDKLLPYGEEMKREDAKMPIRTCPPGRWGLAFPGNAAIAGGCGSILIKDTREGIA
jgi:hypothetical protein